VATGVEAATSSHIEMIKEQVLPEGLGLEVPATLQRVPGWLKWKSSWQALAQKTKHFKLQQLN